MVSDLKFRRADDRDRRAAFTNTFEVWPMAKTLDEHVERRMASPKFRQADWFVGCLGDRIVTSLGAYPEIYMVRGQMVPGFSIGGVHTVMDCRGRGYAPELIDYVEEVQREQGARLSLLFSDIEPAYYARLGYVQCPSYYAWADVGQGSLVENLNILRAFKPISASEIEELSATYTAAHRRLPIWIFRKPEYWDRLLRNDPADEYFRIEGDSPSRGYVRVQRSKDALFIRDSALEADDENVLSEVLAACIALGRSRGVQRVGGWLPNTATVRAQFKVTPRDREITMFKSLDGSIALDEELVAAAEHFREIDHV